MAYQLQPGQTPEDVVNQMMGLAGPMGGPAMLRPGASELGKWYKYFAGQMKPGGGQRMTGLSEPKIPFGMGQFRGGSNMKGQPGHSLPNLKSREGDETLIDMLLELFTRAGKN